MGERRGITGFLLDLATAGWIVGRVLLFTAIGIGIFLVAFLGYFTLPFIFLTVAVALIGMNTFIRQIARIRAWIRRQREE